MKFRKHFEDWLHTNYSPLHLLPRSGKFNPRRGPFSISPASGYYVAFSPPCGGVGPLADSCPLSCRSLFYRIALKFDETLDGQFTIFCLTAGLLPERNQALVQLPYKPDNRNVIIWR